MKFQTLSIVVGNEACNAHCPYCIAKMTPSCTPSAGWNSTNFGACCRLAVAGGVTTALITGKGEPTLFPDQCTKCISMAAVYFPIIELQTNGMLLGRLADSIDCWKSTASFRDSTLLVAISVVHYDDKMNKKIYSPKNTYTSLAGRISMLHDLGIPVRLNCIGLKGYIDSYQQLCRLIEFARKNKVEQLTWRPVTVPSTTRNTEAARAVRSAASDLQVLGVNEICRQVRMNNTLLLSLPHGGEVFDFDGQNLCMTNCMTHAIDPESIRQLIYVDGHIRYSWQYEGATII